MPVMGYEGLYEVSDLGRVRSVERVVVRSNGVTQKVAASIRATAPKQSGHLCLTLYRDGHGRRFQVHCLMLESFVGPRPPGLQGLHWDDDPTNNDLANLRWGTPGDNRRDEVRNGNHFWANKTHCPRGHPYDDVNTVHSKSGRECRICTARSRREWRQRNPKRRATA